MDTASGLIFVYVILIFVGIILSFVMMRGIFSINTFLKCQQAQTHLLEEIAKQQGVDPEKVDDIINELA